MSQVEYSATEGDQVPFQTTLTKRSDDTAWDVSSGSLKKFRYWYDDGPATEVDASFVSDGSDGKIKYELTIPRAGLLKWVWRVNDGSKTQTATSPDGRPFQIVVERKY